MTQIGFQPFRFSPNKNLQLRQPNPAATQGLEEFR
jgi:hypothetical protein